MVPAQQLAHDFLPGLYSLDEGVAAVVLPFFTFIAIIGRKGPLRSLAILSYRIKTVAFEPLRHLYFGVALLIGDQWCRGCQK